jgi:hypothetical protein
MENTLGCDDGEIVCVFQEDTELLCKRARASRSEPLRLHRDSVSIMRLTGIFLDEDSARKWFDLVSGSMANIVPNADAHA